MDTNTNITYDLNQCLIIYLVTHLSIMFYNLMQLASKPWLRFRFNYLTDDYPSYSLDWIISFMSQSYLYKYLHEHKNEIAVGKSITCILVLASKILYPNDKCPSISFFPYHHILAQCEECFNIFTLLVRLSLYSIPFLA